jgi:flagellar motor protein MotB
MKIVLLLLCLFLFSCATQKKLETLNKEQLISELMYQSLLDTTVQDIVKNAPKCLGSYTLLPQDIRDTVIKILNESFSYEEMHSEIEKQLNSKLTKEEALALAVPMQGNVWRDYKDNVLYLRTQSGEQRLISRYNEITSSSIDLEAPRSQKVQALQAKSFSSLDFTEVAMNVAKQMSADQIKKLTQAQIDYQNKYMTKELEKLNKKVKNLNLAIEFEATSSLSDQELDEVLVIKDHIFFKESRSVLEKSYARRIQEFSSKLVNYLKSLKHD